MFRLFYLRVPRRRSMLSESLHYSEPTDVSLLTFRRLEMSARHACVANNDIDISIDGTLLHILHASHPPNIPALNNINFLIFSRRRCFNAAPSNRRLSSVRLLVPPELARVAFRTRGRYAIRYHTCSSYMSHHEPTSYVYPTSPTITVGIRRTIHPIQYRTSTHVIQCNFNILLLAMLSLATRFR